MLSGLFVLLVTGILSFAILGRLKGKYPFLDVGMLQKLFFFHMFMAFVYYLYALSSPSDSQFYYEKVLVNYRGNTWSDFYGTSTPFIEFLAYPFIKFLGFSYEAMMLLFAFIGYLGFVYFYIFFKEHIHFKHELYGMDMITVFLFLPNMHFWTVSLGKGPVIFLGMALFFFGISRLRTRFVALIVSGLIIYHVRPHIMLIVLIASIVGFVFSSKRLGLFPRLLFLAGASIVLFFIYQRVFEMVGINEDEVVTQGLDLTHRATELTKATSGVDITNYSLPLQVFTFLYRPLFFDAPGVLGLIVSFENVFYLLISLRLFTFKGLRYLVSSDFLVKSAFVTFILVSIALAQVSGNLGIAIRQKSQVMMLFMFVVISFLDEQKRKSTPRKAARVPTPTPVAKPQSA